MKKIIYALLLVWTGFITAQKTVVTKNGEILTPILNATNGLTNNNGSLELGGTLTKPTKITTSTANALEINSGGSVATPIPAIKIVDGGQGANKVLVSDANGAASWQTDIGGQTSYFQEFIASVPAVPAHYPIAANTSVALPGWNTYTAPVAGRYQVFFHSFFTSSVRDQFFIYHFQTYNNTTLINEIITSEYTGSYFNTHQSQIVVLTAGETINFKILTPSSTFYIETNLANRCYVEVIYIGI